MDSKILQLMESANPQDRKKAIKMLAQTGGQEALRYLGQIYKQESDPEIKELAINAGKYIKKQEASGTAPAPQPAAKTFTQPVTVVEEVVEDEPEEDEPQEEFKPVVVSEASKKQAKGLMDRALDLSMHGEKDKAIESITKAFKVNPNLQLDSYYMGVAMDITGLDKDATLRLIAPSDKTRKAQKEKAKNKEKAKAKNDGSSGDSDEIGWDTALIDLATYFVVVSAVMIIGMIAVIQIVTSAFNTMQSCGCDSTSVSQSLELLKFLRGAGIVLSILYSLVVGLFSTIILLVQYALIHGVAKFLFGGEGSFTGLIHRATVPQTVAAAVTSILAGLMIYLILQPLTDKAVLQSGQGVVFSPLIPFLSLGVVIVGLGCVIWMVSRIGKNYDFGFGRGCATVILAYIGFSILSTICNVAFTNTIISMLNR